MHLYVAIRFFDIICIICIYMLYMLLYDTIYLIMRYYILLFYVNGMLCYFSSLLCGIIFFCITLKLDEHGTVIGTDMANILSVVIKPIGVLSALWMC